MSFWKNIKGFYLRYLIWDTAQYSQNLKRNVGSWLQHEYLGKVERVEALLFPITFLYLCQAYRIWIQTKNNLKIQTNFFPGHFVDLSYIVRVDLNLIKLYFCKCKALGSWIKEVQEVKEAYCIALVAKKECTNSDG